MNLEESTNFAQEFETKNRKKKLIILSMIVCIIVIVLLFILIAVIRYQDSLTLKMYINGNQVSISNTLFKSDEDTTYINIREVSQMFGYTYTKGEYGKYNEDINSCYLQNNFEIIAITAELPVLTKYTNYIESPSIGNVPVTVKSQIGDFEYYTLEHPVKLIDGALYIEFEKIPEIFNIKLDLSESNRIKIFTIEALLSNTQAFVSRLGYTELSGYYENMKAIIDNMVVVGNGNAFGVISLKDGSELISVKYKDIVYIQNSKEFLVTADKTVGILDSEGKTIIKPTEYDEISLLDQINKLYLVKKDKEYGVLDEDGKTIIYAEYDQIGYKNVDNSDDEKIKGNVIFDTCIPVKKDGKYGLYSITGEELLQCSYEEFGYKKQSTDKSGEESVFIIPTSVGIEGIVICYDKLYGIYDTNKNEIIIPCVCTRIYSMTKSGNTSYYVEYNGEQIELSGYLKDNNLISEKEDKLEEQQTNDIPEEENNEVNADVTDNTNNNE